MESPGAGSTFYFAVSFEVVEVPAAVAADEAPGAVAPEYTPLRILVAEDNAVNRKLARRLLEKHGHYVSTVMSARIFHRTPETLRGSYTVNPVRIHG